MDDILQSEFDRRLWHLRHEQHWSVSRIARWLNVSTATVSRRLTQLQLQHDGYRRRRPRPSPTRRKFRPVSLSGLYNI